MAGGNPGAQWAVGVVRGEPGEERVSHRGIGGPDRSAEESALLIDEESRHANDARILRTGKQKVIAPDVTQRCHTARKPSGEKAAKGNTC